MTTRSYARRLSEWLEAIGLDPHVSGTRLLRRAKATVLSAETSPLSVSLNHKLALNDIGSLGLR